VVKKWFYPRNDADAPLPTFTGKCPIPQPSWGYEVAKKDLNKMQHLREVIQ
jgi:hypothetical protein